MFLGMLDLFLPGVYTGQEMCFPIMNLRDYLLRWDLQRLSMIIRRQSPPQRNQKPKQHSRMIQSIHDIYAQDSTFLDELASDLEDGAVWFNNSEFARFHDIDGVKLLSVFTANKHTRRITISNDNENPEGVKQTGGVLFCRAQEVGHVNAEQPLRIDGKLYTVLEARLIQGQIWRIEVEANRP